MFLLKKISDDKIASFPKKNLLLYLTSCFSARNLFLDLLSFINFTNKAVNMNIIVPFSFLPKIFGITSMIALCVERPF